MVVCGRVESKVMSLPKHLICLSNHEMQKIVIMLALLRCGIDSGSVTFITQYVSSIQGQQVFVH